MTKLTTGADIFTDMDALRASPLRLTNPLEANMTEDAKVAGARDAKKKKKRD
jgi:hypothetical protein